MLVRDKDPRVRCQGTFKDRTRKEEISSAIEHFLSSDTEPKTNTHAGTQMCMCVNVNKMSASHSDNQTEEQTAAAAAALLTLIAKMCLEKRRRGGKSISKDCKV